MSSLTERTLEEYRARGFVVLNQVVPPDFVPELRREVERLTPSSLVRGGVRNGLGKSALLRDLGEDLGSIAGQFLRQGVQPVKLTIFDKTPKANWKVPMHQDLTITVRQRLEVPGFGPWSEKGGLPHVQPPANILESIIAIRLHLDETPASGGALRVIPSSHRLGRLSHRKIQSLQENTETVVCPVAAGGAMVMSPLLVHASSPARAPDHRRVLHFEFTAIDLPGGLEWSC